MNAIEARAAEARAIEAEFPGWEAWFGIDNLWHARVKGKTPEPGDFLTGEDPQDLKDQIRRFTGLRDF